MYANGCCENEGKIASFFILSERIFFLSRSRGERKKKIKVTSKKEGKPFRSGEKERRAWIRERETLIKSESLEEVGFEFFISVVD